MYTCLTLPQVCNNLSAHEERNVLVQREFSVFTFYNSIIMSVIPLIFVLFMGAWSDIYGRKVSLKCFVGYVYALLMHRFVIKNQFDNYNHSS